MANLTLVYGMRLLPSDEVAEGGEAPVKLKNGREAHVTMHVLEGSKEEIEKRLGTSLEAFLDVYPEFKEFLVWPLLTRALGYLCAIPCVKFKALNRLQLQLDSCERLIGNGARGWWRLVCGRGVGRRRAPGIR